MFSLRTNLPPSYDTRLNVPQNFERFFSWGLELRKPFKTIPEMGERLGFGIRVHPLGFMAVYLSPPSRGLHTMSIWGTARADIFFPGNGLQDDIHSHGFDFVSGIVSGTLLNTRHYPDFSQCAPNGTGFVGYETRTDSEGNNHTTRATDATVVVPEHTTERLTSGDTYTMQPRTDFHSVDSPEGAITIFCKTPTYSGHDGLALLLRRPESPAPSESY